MYTPLLLLSVVSINCQSILQNQLTKFSEASCQSRQSMCANSSASRSFNVRTKAQCILECQHGGDTSSCVGVNFRQNYNTCEVYNTCPTAYTDLVTGCQYLERERKTPAPAACLVSMELPRPTTKPVNNCNRCTEVSRRWTSVDRVQSVVTARTLSRCEKFGNPPYPYASVSDCSFPFTNNGAVYYDCQPTLFEDCSFETCLLSDRSVAICYPHANCLVNTISTSLTVGTLTPIVVLSVFNWIVIQQRLPTSDTAFEWNLNWASYKDGFGISGSNFWLGLERMYLLTSSASYRLRVEVQQTSSGMWYSAEYTSFTVGDESNSKYQLGVSGYRGDAGDALQVQGFFYHNGMKFSTFDSDNDLSILNCALTHGGGWWFNSCYEACTSCDDGQAIWQGPGGPLDSNYLIQAARMMIKLNAG